MISVAASVADEVSLDR